ncbi:MAG: CSLREA domain-containing protein [Verrucomicrobia bacterium]|nr:CSLREA domain-containing protein [Verrucomicrobiota bacterium]
MKPPLRHPSLKPIVRGPHPRSSVRVAVHRWTPLLLSGVPLLAAPRSSADTFVVTSTLDPGDGVCNAAECTLREAITAANANPGADVIAFDIPGSGVHTIQPLSELPPITEALTSRSGPARAGCSWTAGCPSVAAPTATDGWFSPRFVKPGVKVWARVGCHATRSLGSPFAHHEDDRQPPEPRAGPVEPFIVRAYRARPDRRVGTGGSHPARLQRLRHQALDRGVGYH